MSAPARRALIVGLAVALLAGCGGGGDAAAPDNGERGRPAARILQDTVAALRAATAVHMYGTIPAGNDASIGLDLHCTRAGDLTGTITVGGVSGDLVVDGSTIYLSGRALFASLFGAPASARIGDRWVAMPGASGPGSDIVEGLGTFTDLGHLADVLASPTGGTVTRGAVSTVDGRSVIALRDSGSVLYVATTGTPYPVELKPDAGGGALHFAAWDQPVRVSAPHDALDLAALAGEVPGAGSPTP